MNNFLVTGATGHLGGLSIEALLKVVPANQISVLARDPAKAAGMSACGIKVVRGDYFDEQSLVNAFRGVDKLLLIGAISMSNRAPQHENMMKAVKAAGVGHVVYVSFQRKEQSKIKLREVTDVEIESEQALIHSGVPYTIVRNPLYANAFKLLLGGNVLEDGVRGFSPESKTTYASIEDLGQANANLLTQEGHKNKIYNLNSGEAVTLKDMARLWSEVYGKTVKYIPTTRQEFIDALVAKGTPMENAEYVTAFLHAVAEGEFSETSDALEKILRRKPRSLKEVFQADLKS